MTVVKSVLSVAVLASSGYALAEPGKTHQHKMTAPAMQNMMQAPAHAEAAQLEASQKAQMAKQHGQERAQLAHENAELKKQAAELKVETAQQQVPQVPAQLSVAKEKLATSITPAQQEAVTIENKIEHTPAQAKTELQPQASQAEVKKEKKGWFNWFKKSA